MERYGVPAQELSDAELERQGTHAHATRNHVFLHGTAEQFRHHTERMLELEQVTRELGSDPARVAALYRHDPPLLATAGAYRYITDAGRARVAERSAEP